MKLSCILPTDAVPLFLYKLTHFILGLGCLCALRVFSQYQFFGAVFFVACDYKSRTDSKAALLSLVITQNLQRLTFIVNFNYKTKDDYSS